jgi:hypothetical protein
VRQAIDAGDHEYVTLAKEVRMVLSSSRPWVVVPLRFSARMTSQPSRLNVTILFEPS